MPTGQGAVETRRFSGGALWLGLLVLVPIVAVGCFIGRFGVDVPFWDDWIIAPQIQRLASGHSIFAQAWRPHGEQRHLVGRLILPVVAVLTHWNICVQLFLNYGVAIATFLKLLSMARPEKGTRRDSLDSIVAAVTAFSVFSLAAYQTWLLSFSLCWLLCPLAVVSATAALTRTDRTANVRLLTGAALCLMASLSTANGLLSWVALAPLLLTIPGTRRQTVQRLALWLAAFAVTSLVYSINYVRPPGLPIFLTALSHPISLLSYGTAILGTPLIMNAWLAPAAGVLQIAAFVMLTARACSQGLWREAAGSISLGIFTLLFGASVTVGRFQSGSDSALASRYVTSSALLIVAVYQIAACVVRKSSSPSPRRWLLAFAILTILLHIAAWPASIQEAGLAQRSRLVGRAALELNARLVPGSSGAWDRLYPDEGALRSWADLVEKSGVRTFRKNVLFAGAPSPAAGAIRSRRIRVGTVTATAIHGSLSAVDRADTPPVVLLSRDDEERFIAIGTTAPDGPPDGWTVVVPPSLLGNAHHLRAWLYSGHPQRFVPLDGVAEIVRVGRP